MRSIVRAAALLLTVVATGYFLQAGAFSNAPLAPRVQPIAVSLLNMVAPYSEREYFLSPLRAGYDTAVTTTSAIGHSLADRYTWTRVRVSGGESLSEFAQNLGSPVPSISITALDIEIADVALPAFARPTHPRPK